MLKKISSIFATAALLIAGMTATPAMALDATFVPETSTAESGVFSTVESPTSGQFDVPAGYKTFSIEQRYSLQPEFVSSHAGQTLSLGVVINDPNGNEISESNGSQAGVTYSVRKQESITGEIYAVVSLLGSDLDHTALVPDGSYSVEVTLSAEGISVEDDVNVSKAALVSTYALGSSPVTVPSNTVSSSLAGQICLDSAKIAVGDVVKAEAWFDGALVSSTANFSTRSSFADPTKVSYRSGATAAASITINKFDQSFGTAAKFQGLSVLASSGTVHTYGFKLYKTSNNADVSGTCAPATPLAPAVAVSGNAILATGALTFGAGSSGTICDFYDRAAPDVKVKSVYAAAGVAGTTTYSCNFSAGIGGHSYFAKVSQRYQSAASEVSLASADIVQPLRTLTQTPVPTISGEAAVGQTLTAEENNWDEGTTFTYEWLASGVAIEGANEKTFTPTTAQYAKTITVRVTGSLDGYTPVTRTSTATVSVGAGTASLIGGTTVGDTITVQLDGWGQTESLDYVWTLDGAPISGETTDTYTPVANDAGHLLSVTITATLPGLPSMSVVTDPIAIQAVDNGGGGGGEILDAPVSGLLGDAVTFETLTADSSAWPQGIDLSYQWLLDGEAIDGATESTYVLSSTDGGHAISVSITGAPDGVNVLTSTSDALDVALADQTLTPTPEIAGVLRVGKTLTAQTGDWAPGVEFSFQWYIDGEPVEGATDATFVLPPASLGLLVYVSVTGNLEGYNQSEQVSDSQEVLPGTLLKTPVPTISGSVKCGQKLTAVTGTWDTGVVFTYVWKVAGKTVFGANSKTFMIPGSALGKTITVVVTGFKEGYTSVSKTSKVTVKVAVGVMTVFATPAIVGVVAGGKSVTATPGVWVSGAKFAYTWMLDGKAIRGATSYKLTIAKTAKGHKLSVSVTATAAGFTALTKVSKVVKVG